ncbi:unnamed protein product [Rangifer tarandus platyrhynchus]|uniref:Uncharacterized protein n=1 Tax=Rangifer tarandus platyrhynchus TaxID=3082113 RepID=A0AC59Y0T2_RANTA
MPDLFINTSMTVFLFHLIVSISVYIQVSAPFICGLLASCFTAPKIVTLSKRARHFGFKFFKSSVAMLPFYTIVTKGLYSGWTSMKIPLNPHCPVELSVVMVVV